MSKLDKEVINIAIGNCIRSDYPITVTSEDFADDLANALQVINKLLDRVEYLEHESKDLRNALKVSNATNKKLMQNQE